LREPERGIRGIKLQKRRSKGDHRSGRGSGCRIDKILRRVLLFPARIPRLRLETVDLLRKVCELSGVSLVLALMVLMVAERGPAIMATVIAAVVFVSSFVLIRLRIYQDRLVDHGYMR
jgi:hypothetical protein